MKVALVYDWVNKIGGAERVLQTLHEIWPDAPLYTAVYEEKRANWAKDIKIIPSFAQGLPLAKSCHEFYPWLIPFIFESFDFSDFDVVISITSAGAKGIIVKPNTLHICYCLTPPRYLYSHKQIYLDSLPMNFITKLWVEKIFQYLTKWDQEASLRPDYYVAISKAVQKRIETYYQRSADIIHPPIDLNQFKGQKTEEHLKIDDYFLIVSRLVSYKRIDIAIEVFNELGWKLKIIGFGSEMNKLKHRAKSNICFLGQLTDREILSYYQNCRALVFPGEEDFGLTSLEAQAMGKPVIAYGAGGVVETIKENITGTFFLPQTSKALKEKLLEFVNQKYNEADCRNNVLKFDKKIFIDKFRKFVEEKWQQFQKMK